MLEYIKSEEKRSSESLHLTANENVLSEVAQQSLSSPLANRYHLGIAEELICENQDPCHGEPCFKAYPNLYHAEAQGKHTLCSMLNGSHCDIRPLSGIHATMATLLTFSNPGDLIYSLPSFLGGHHATRGLIESMGRLSQFLPYNPVRLTLDLHQIAQLPPPKMIFLDDSAPIAPLPVKQLKERFPETIFIYDASHTLGLICGKGFQSPLLEGADIVQGNTHKTFFGPQKGIVVFKNKIEGLKFQETMTERLVSSQHTGSTISLLIAIEEMKVYGELYIKQLQCNARALATFLREKGFDLFSHPDHPDIHTHILLLKHPLPQEFCRQLHRVGISTNCKRLFDRVFIRIGVQEVTRRGMKEPQMKMIATFFQMMKNGRSIDTLQSRIADWVRDYQTVHYTWDKKEESCFVL